MKFYFASSAPGSETNNKIGVLLLKKRLLSYYHVIEKKFDIHKIFNYIENETTNNIRNKTKRKSK
jgi:hypothetical protein